jgi:hypothetical protein
VLIIIPSPINNRVMSILPESIVQMRQHLDEKKTTKAAWDIIHEYFNFFGIDHIKNELWVLTVGTITNDEMQQSENGKDRYNLIFFFEYTRIFVEAIHTLCEDRSQMK